MTHIKVYTLQLQMLNATTHSHSIIKTEDHLNDAHSIFQLKLTRDLLKSVWECSEMKVSQWKILHPSDTEDEQNVGISSKDEAEDLEAAPGVARRGSGRPAAPDP